MGQEGYDGPNIGDLLARYRIDSVRVDEPRCRLFEGTDTLLDVRVFLRMPTDRSRSVSPRSLGRGRPRPCPGRAPESGRCTTS